MMKKRLKELSEKFDANIDYYLEKAEEAAKIKEIGEMTFWIKLAKEKTEKERIDISANIRNIKKILKNE